MSDYYRPKVTSQVSYRVNKSHCCGDHFERQGLSRQCPKWAERCVHGGHSQRKQRERKQREALSYQGPQERSTRNNERKAHVRPSLSRLVGTFGRDDHQDSCQHIRNRDYVAQSQIAELLCFPNSCW